MNRFDFQAQLDRLTKVYGANAFPEERVSLIWADVKDIPAHDFSAAVSQLIARERTAPMPSKIREFLEYVRSRRYQNRKHEFMEQVVKKGTCEKCQNFGSIAATKKEDHTIWAFRCTCEAGDFFSYPYPLWSDEKHLSVYDYMPVPKQSHQDYDLIPF